VPILADRCFSRITYSPTQMKKNSKDTIDKTEVEFRIIVIEHTKKGKKSTHPDFEDAPARMITEYEVAGSVTIKGIVHNDILKMNCYNETSLLENLPKFESNLWEKAAVLVRTAKTETFASKLKNLGYE
jgi:hypothetical protein